MRSTMIFLLLLAGADSSAISSPSHPLAKTISRLSELHAELDRVSKDSNVTVESRSQASQLEEELAEAVASGLLAPTYRGKATWEAFGHSFDPVHHSWGETAHPSIYLMVAELRSFRVESIKAFRSFIRDEIEFLDLAWAEKSKLVSAELAAKLDGRYSNELNVRVATLTGYNRQLNHAQSCVELVLSLQKDHGMVIIHGSEGPAWSIAELQRVHGVGDLAQIAEERRNEISNRIDEALGKSRTAGNILKHWGMQRYGCLDEKTFAFMRSEMKRIRGLQ